MGRTQTTTVLFLSDQHIDSQWGLWDPKFEIKKHPNGTPSCMNGIQTILWEDWVNLCNRLRNLRPDIIVLIGDIINPPSRRRNQSVTNDPSEQFDCALSLLRMIPRKKHTSTLGLIGSHNFDQQYLECTQRLYSALGDRKSVV